MYTIDGVKAGKYAGLTNTDGMVTWEQRDLDSDERQTLEEAARLAEDGDKEGAIKHFQGLFGEDNVIVKN